MSKRNNKGRGKASQPSTAAKVEEKLTPIQELLKNLYVVSEARLVAKEKRLSSEALAKVLASLETVVLSIMKDPKKEEWQKHAIRLILTVQTSSGHGPIVSKKLVSIFFTFLIDEIKRHWREYGIKEEDVHDDYKQEEAVESESKVFEIQDISKEEYASWERAFLYATGVC